MDFFFFSWRVIALSCCVGFRYTTVWVSCMYTYIPLPWASLPHPHPSTLGRHQAELPGLCSSPHELSISPLAVSTVSQRLFQCVPCPSSHCVHKFALFVCRMMDFRLTNGTVLSSLNDPKSSIECTHNRQINILCNYGCTVRVLMSIKSLCFWSSCVCSMVVSPAHTPATQ